MDDRRMRFTNNGMFNDYERRGSLWHEAVYDTSFKRQPTFIQSLDEIFAQTSLFQQTRMGLQGVCFQEQGGAIERVFIRRQAL